MTLDLSAHVPAVSRYKTTKSIVSLDGRAYLVIGTVLIPGAAAPKVVMRDIVRIVRSGSVIVDSAIEEGEGKETSRPTTHSNQIYVLAGLTHCGVASMAGGLARSATLGLGNATLPCVHELANQRWRSEFSLWRIESRYEISGLVVKDVLRNKETWLVDESLTDCVEPRLTFAARLYWPAAFAMTCGVVVPVYAALVEDTLFDNMASLQHTDLNRLADDPRFAAAIYRSALEAEIIEHVEVREPVPAIAWKMAEAKLSAYIYSTKRVLRKYARICTQSKHLNR
jgi:hypothetical protein